MYRTFISHCLRLWCILVSRPSRVSIIFSYLIWISITTMNVQSLVLSINRNRNLLSRRSRLYSSLEKLDTSRCSSNCGSATVYERLLASPKFIAAPMVSQSDYAFRTLCRRYGVDCAYTQMYHAKNFALSKAYQDKHMDIYPAFLKFVPTEKAHPFHEEELLPLEGGPLVAQIAGHDPSTMLQVAQTIIERTSGYVQAIDVNLGCPQQIAKKGKYGAFLLRDMDTVCSVLSTLRRGLPKETVGLTAKIRIPDYDDARGTALIQCIQQLIDSGVDWITVHGRTLYENKTAVRQCNWDKIALAVRTAQEYSNGQVPVIANGGIEYPSDVVQCLELTGAAGVMSSEALLENPGLFAPNAIDEPYMSPRQLLERQFSYAYQYLDLAAIYPPVPGSMGGSQSNAGHGIVKAHLFKFLHRYFQESPDLRDLLANNYKTSQIQHTRQVVTQLWERYVDLSDEQIEQASSSRSENTWYRRHRTPRAGRIHSPRVDKNTISSEVKYSNCTAAFVDVITPEEKKESIHRRIEQLRTERLQRQQSKDTNLSTITF